MVPSVSVATRETVHTAIDVRRRRPAFAAWLSIERDGALAAVIVASAAALRLIGINRGLPYLHEWDEIIVLPPVIRMALYHTLNPGVFIYTSLYYYLLLPVVYAHAFYLHVTGGPSIDTIAFAHPLIPDYRWYSNIPSFFLWARGLTALLSAATVYVTYRLGREAFGRPVGLLAAAVLAVAPGAIYYADTVRVDVPMALLATAALWSGMSILRGGNARDYLVTGLLSGLAISTKQIAVWLLPAVAVAHVLSTHRRLTTVRAGGLAAAGVVLGGLAGTPYVLIQPLQVWADFATLVRPYGLVSVPRADTLLHQFGLSLAYLARPTQGADWYVVPHFALGLAPAAAAAVGIAVGLREQPRVQAYLLTMPLLLLLFIARAQEFYTRNLTAVLPVACIATAVGGMWVWRRLAPVLDARPPLARMAAAAALCILLLGGPARASVSLAWWLHRHDDTRTQALRWLDGHTRPGMVVAFEVELAWFLPALERAPFTVEWTDRNAPLSWYNAHHVDLAVLNDRNAPPLGRRVATFVPPPYLPSSKEQATFVPNTYPIIDPPIVIVRPGAP
jgi:hypothetical protein